MLYRIFFFMSNPFVKKLEDLKLIFLDTETSFDNIESLTKPQWEYHSPVLRLMTFQTFDGKTLSETKTLDAMHLQRAAPRQSYFSKNP